MKYLNLISNIDNEGIRDRLNSDPAVAPADLEARNLMIWEEKGHATRI
ncbi:hypothetical protein Leryth_004831 [Lithospermum erythrorhizon]|nr:hypothetical protein Leryth_004831 [Lithospermum erythrorhizon]